MGADSLILVLGLIGVVIIIASLLSGFIERTNFPQVAVFLALGAIIGPHGFGLLNVELNTPILRMVATLSLTLVLFTDALTLNLAEVKKHATTAFIILVPGTLLATAVITWGGMAILGLPIALAAILAAPLASTDPVLLRGLLRKPDLDTTARLALRLESGLNDVVLLPVVLVAMMLVSRDGDTNAFKLLLQMLVLGPGAGALIAWLGLKLLQFMRRQVGVRRDYESLYSIGLALAAFAAAEAMHGSGFLAAFAAGLTIAALDVELCDCFREYGETTAEMLLLFTFVLLGTSLIWQGIGVITLAVAAFVIVALLARPIALFVALMKIRASGQAKRTIIWFGPRGLSSLLLILVPVFASTKGADQLFHIASVVVLVSVVIHGGSMMLQRSPVETPEEGAKAITVQELRELIDSGEQVVIVDVRSESSYSESESEIVDALRLHPSHIIRDAQKKGLPKDAWAALFCT